MFYVKPHQTRCVVMCCSGNPPTSRVWKVSFRTSPVPIPQVNVCVCSEGSLCICPSSPLKPHWSLHLYGVGALSIESEREIVSITEEVSRIDRVGRGRGTPVSLCTRERCCRARKKERERRQLIDATRSRCRAVLGSTKQHASRRFLHLSVRFSLGAVGREGEASENMPWYSTHTLEFLSHARSRTLSITWAFSSRLTAVCVFSRGLFSLLLSARWRAMRVCVRAMPRQALPVSSASGPSSSLCLPELRYCLCFPCTVLLQHGADPNIRNTDGKSALDLADLSAKAVLTGEYRNLMFSITICACFICLHLLFLGFRVGSPAVCSWSVPSERYYFYTGFKSSGIDT